jgi:hypothetical protein
MVKINSEWLMGFLEGESSFIYKEYKRGNTTQRLIALQLGQNNRDYELLLNIHKFLNLGNCYKHKHHSQIRIAKREEILKLINFIDSTTGFKGYKQSQYLEWKSKILAM